MNNKRLTHIHKKSVGVLLLLVPHSEALALPDSQETRQRRSPRRYVYMRQTTEANNGCLLKCTDITYPMDVHCCFVVDCHLKSPEIRVSSTKRQVTPFLYIRFSFLTLPKAGFGMMNVANLRNLYLTSNSCPLKNVKWENTLIDKNTSIFMKRTHQSLSYQIDVQIDED